MKRVNTLKFISVILAVVVLFSSCASTTMIQSMPSGAKVYLNGEPVGTTPYSHTDTKVVGTRTSVSLKKEGYKTLETSFSRDEEIDAGALVGGFFAWIPFLWVMKYKSVHAYELSPIIKGEKANSSDKKGNSKIDIDTLRELKKLLDEGVITQEEYKKAKKKILEE